MSPPKVIRLRRKLESLRGKGGVKSSEIESLAKSLGRKRHKRGSEPTWINESFRHLRPVSIPHHSTELNRFTARAILDQLEADLEAWEAESNADEEVSDE
jgi:hypothetical protein